MQDTSKRAEHTRLVYGMADRVGVDLEELVLRAAVTDQEVDHAIDRCIGCTQPGACHCLQDENASLPKLPDYCRNDAFFDGLEKR